MKTALGSRFPNGQRAPISGLPSSSNATCRRILIRSSLQWRCRICPPCLWNNGRGFSREQAVLAGSSHRKVSSTAQEGLDFEIVRCYPRLFVRYISFLVTPDRTKHFVF